MQFFYNLGIQLFYLAILLASKLGIKKASHWIEGRKGWLEKLVRHVGGKNIDIWFHCASMGEFEQAKPLIESYRKAYPDHFILVSFFSPSAYLHYKTYQDADYIFYLPLDTLSNANKLLSAVKNGRVVFVKYEFWFNLLQALEKRNIPTFLVSGIFRKNQQFFKFYGGWFRKRLYAFHHFYVQNDESKVLLKSLGLNNITVSGDSRFDRVASIAEEQFEDHRLSTFCKNGKTIIFGSAWEKENEFALRVLSDFPDFKVIIAPHEIDENKSLTLIERSRSGGVLWSNTSQKDNLIKERLLIIDEIGWLSKVYRFANFAFVGGGFGKGIHNILEAAVYGCPIMFGPKYSIFQEAHDLIDLEVAFSIKDYNEFRELIAQLMEDDERRNDIRSAAKTYIDENKDVASKILKHMLRED